MRAGVFVVRHRTVDLVAMSALRALRVELGVGAGLLALSRDDAFALEGDAAAISADHCLAQAHWFNPNKHRYGYFSADPGLLDGLGKSWPGGWPGRLQSTDRPDLVGRAGAGWEEWIDLGVASSALTLASWDLEEPVVRAPWSGAVRVARLQLWTLAFAEGVSGDLHELVRRCAVTTGRRDGLLVNPHMEGWSFVDRASKETTG